VVVIKVRLFRAGEIQGYLARTGKGDALEKAMARSAVSDLLISVGSSLVVYPAAGMPQIAKT